MYYDSMIVSVSRRCDIPRYHFGWFMERLDEGFADAANPFNAAQVRHVSLLPHDIDALVFWTRAPRNILDYTEELESRGFPFYVMVSLTGYPPLLEPDMPSSNSVIDTMRKLSEKISPGGVIWRYDPVLLSSISGGGFHIQNFTALADALAGSVNRVIISIYDEYKSSKRRLEALEKQGGFSMFQHYERDSGLLTVPVKALLGELARIARERGIAVQSCAEKEDLSSLGIKAGACIDGDLVNTLSGKSRAASGRSPGGLFNDSGMVFGRDRNQRPHCLCAASVDIGRYGLCPAGCAYCYARR
jgi:DNA repair photolyase